LTKSGPVEDYGGGRNPHRCSRKKQDVRQAPAQDVRAGHAGRQCPFVGNGLRRGVARVGIAAVTAYSLPQPRFEADERTLPLGRYAIQLPTQSFSDLRCVEILAG
jgi:hypothetical protein